MCRLTESLKVLELELKVHGESAQTAAVQQLLGGNKEVPLANILLATAGSRDPTSYATELFHLQAWVDGSLDAYRVRRKINLLALPSFNDFKTNFSF